jgi:glycosyltransferase involved in cell wall biosynthesis
MSLNILFLTAHLPVLGLHGGGMRMFYNLKALSQKHRVTLISFIESESENENLPQLENLGVEVKTVLRSPCPSNHWLVPKPIEHDEYHSLQMSGLVKETLSERHFDVIQAEFLQMGQHVPRHLPLLKILTEHEVQFANFFASYKAERHLTWKAKKFYDWMVQLNYEVKTCRDFDRVICMTDEDLALLHEFVPSSRLRKIPIGVDSDYFSPSVSSTKILNSHRLLFVGNYRHSPNRDTVHHFVEEILPLIQGVIPDVEFCVVGANVDLLDRQTLARTNKVNVVGYVKDIRSCYLGAAVFVAPIRSGNGMRVKLLEALSMGMAVVATPLAAYGFSTKDEEHLLLASTPEKFADQTIRLLQDPALRIRLGANARSVIQKHYDWKVIEPQFLELVASRYA